MRENDIKQFENKNVRLSLTNSNSYSGKILTVEKQTTQIQDKFGRFVKIDNEFVASIEELGERGIDNGNKIYS